MSQLLQKSKLLNTFASLINTGSSYPHQMLQTRNARSVEGIYIILMKDHSTKKLIIK